MKCPHCLVEFHDDRKLTSLGEDVDGKWGVESFICPNPKCKRNIYFLVNGEIYISRNGKSMIETTDDGNELIFHRELIRPKGSSRPPVPIEVPQEIGTDYTEACIVLPDSLKASAALSRRALQHLLRQAAGVKPGNLAIEIQEVLDSNKLPSHIADSIDAVRNVGNFAAHPLKSTSTGLVVDVEEGEAEWNLEVLEMLFDFYFVQPEKTRKRREALNKKLSDSGKPDMK
ncbi:MAG: DUF4145 domain-containing protein [Flavobacteriaceae bacterium]